MPTPSRAAAARSVGTALVGTVLLVGTAVTCPLPAWATFRSAATASTSLASGTLAAPVSAAAVSSCLLTARRITVTWPASTSSFATGYAVLRRAGGAGAYAVVGTTAGRLSTTYQDTAVAGSTTYEYVVRATVAQWTADSPPSPSVGTSFLCL